MADRFPFMRVYKDMASKLNKEDRADFYDALIGYALDEEEPEPSIGAAVFEAARRMVDKWKQTSAAGKASAKKRESVRSPLDGRWEVVGNENPTKEEKNKRINNKNNNNKENASLKRSIKESTASRRSEDNEKLQLIMDAYNAICYDMPKATKLTEDRKKHIRARLKDYSEEELGQAFEKAQASDFLSGRKATGRDWHADLDWIISSPQHMQKILEGAYDNKEPRDAAENVARQFIASASPEAVRSFEESMNGGRS